MICSVSYFHLGSTFISIWEVLCLGNKPTKAPRCDGTEFARTVFKSSVWPDQESKSGFDTHQRKCTNLILYLFCAFKRKRTEKRHHISTSFDLLLHSLIFHTNSIIDRHWVHADLWSAVGKNAISDRFSTKTALCAYIAISAQI